MILEMIGALLGSGVVVGVVLYLVWRYERRQS
jgi:hypothetical protein